MDRSTSVFLAIIAVLVLNQAVHRLPVLTRLRLLFWSVVCLDVGLAAGAIVFGLPGFQHAPSVSWVVGLLLGLHIVQNIRARSALVREDRMVGTKDETAERARQIRAALGVDEDER